MATGYNHLPRIAGTIRPFVEDTLDHGVVTLIEVADPITPVDTGALVSNKTIERGVGSRDITWIQPYAAYQEFGTSHGVPARKFGATGADAAQEAMDTRLATWEGSL